ncbi:cytochrome b [Glacieibacterium frigidum]|uniref:Cytochrome b n=1 Tax=Glacieibacterium frigidum TaxID=2593303 RepID=A0A552UHY7_9SPHN|nr:cytochrome b [Glacieibacterium frigidum]TRW17807.1 cytochrome b [Glacieibacterium frigidum]
MAIHAGRSRYSSVAIAFHWVIAVLLIGNLAGGLLFDIIEDADKSLFFTLVQLHKSTGITILVLAVLRLAWRLMNPAPPLPDHMTPAERVLAKLSHWGFYVLMIALPLSGWAMTSTAKIKFPMLWYGLFEVPPLPAPTGWNYHDFHGILGWVAVAMIVLHVAAALKHQYFDRDDIFARMSMKGRR